MKKTDAKSKPKTLKDDAVIADAWASLKGLDYQGVIELFNKIHNSKLDDKEKLREKDIKLIAIIDELNKKVGRAEPWIQNGLYEILVLLVQSLAGIEMVLWELKGFEGNPPFPKPKESENGPKR